MKLDELEAHKRGHINAIRGVLLRSASNDLAILNDLELRVTLFAFRYILVEATDKVDGEDRAHDTKEEHHGDSDKVHVFRRRQHAGHDLHSHRPSLVVWGEGCDVNILTDEPKNGDNSNSKLQKCATVPLRHRHLVIIGTVGGVLRVAREDGVDPVDNAKAVKKDKAEGDHSRVGIKKGGERVAAQKKANETGQEAHPVISVRGKIFHPRTSNVPARHESQGHCDELKGRRISECSIHGVRDEGSDDKIMTPCLCVVSDRKLAFDLRKCVSLVFSLNGYDAREEAKQKRFRSKRRFKCNAAERGAPIPDTSTNNYVLNAGSAHCTMLYSKDMPM